MGHEPHTYQSALQTGWRWRSATWAVNHVCVTEPQ